MIPIIFGLLIFAAAWSIFKDNAKNGSDNFYNETHIHWPQSNDLRPFDAKAVERSQKYWRLQRNRISYKLERGIK